MAAPKTRPGGRQNGPLHTAISCVTHAHRCWPGGHHLFCWFGLLASLMSMPLRSAQIPIIISMSQGTIKHSIAARPSVTSRPRPFAPERSSTEASGKAAEPQTLSNKKRSTPLRERGGGDLAGVKSGQQKGGKWGAPFLWCAKSLMV